MTEYRPTLSFSLKVGRYSVRLFFLMLMSHRSIHFSLFRISPRSKKKATPAIQTSTGGFKAVHKENSHNEDYCCPLNIKRSYVCACVHSYKKAKAESQCYQDQSGKTNEEQFSRLHILEKYQRLGVQAHRYRQEETGDQGQGSSLA